MHLWVFHSASGRCRCTRTPPAKAGPSCAFWDRRRVRSLRFSLVVSGQWAVISSQGTGWSRPSGLQEGLTYFRALAPEVKYMVHDRENETACNTPASATTQRRWNFGKLALGICVVENVIVWGVLSILARMGAYTSASVISEKSADLARFILGNIATISFIASLALSIAGLVEGRSRTWALVALVLAVPTNWMIGFAFSN
jgi:hypothetical protein